MKWNEKKHNESSGTEIYHSDFDNKAEEISEKFYAYGKNNHLNIVLIGKTGAGKSTLINAIFGENMAITGVGKPITPKTEAFTSPTNPNFKIYDTKGIELSEPDKAFNEVSKLIISKQKTRDTGDDIDFIFYCIATTDARVQDFDIKLVKRLINKTSVPVVVVLTKSIDEDETKQMKVELDKENISVAAVNSVPKKTKAGEIESYGIEELVDYVYKNIENTRSKIEFAKMQKASLKTKKDSALVAIHTASVASGAVGAIPIPGADAPLIVITQLGMLTSINSIFDIKVSDGFLKDILLDVLAANLGKAAAKALIKLIPVAGEVIDAGVAIAFTETLGFGYLNLLLKYPNILEIGKSLPPEFLEYLKEEIKNINFKKH